MITFEQAKKKVFEELKRLDGIEPKNFSHKLVEELTREEAFGWVFFYNSKEFIETGNSSLALAGNSPYIVDRDTGELYETNSAFPVEIFIRLYLKYRNQPDEYKKRLLNPYS